MLNLQELKVQLQNLHNKLMDISPFTGKNIKSFEETANGAVGLYGKLKTDADNIYLKVVSDKEAKELELKTKTNQFDMSRRKNDGKTFGGELELTNANYGPRIEHLEKEIPRIQIQHDQLDEELHSKNIARTKKGWSLFLHILSFLVTEGIAMALIVFNETSINKIVFEAIPGITPDQTTQYAYGMSIALAGYVWVAGYFVKVGLFHPTRKWKKMTWVGLAMLLPILALVWYLVGERTKAMIAEAVAAAVDGEEVTISENSRPLFFILSSLYYLLGMLPPILFSSPIPFWEAKAIKNDLQKLEDLEGKLKIMKEELISLKTKKGQEVAKIKTEYTFDDNSQFVSQELKDLRKLVEITLPNEIEVLEVLRIKTSARVNKFKENTDKLQAGYLTALAAKYEENLPDEDKVNFPALKSKFSSLMTMLVIALFLFQSCSDAPEVPTYDIVNVFDQTEVISYEGKVSAESFKKEMGVGTVGSNTTGKGRLLFSTINNVDLNEDYEVLLEYDRNIHTNTVITRKVKKFNHELKELLPKVTAPVAEEEKSSRIFGPIITNIEKIDKSADYKYLNLFSDLIEHRTEISFYQNANNSVYSLLGKDDEKIRERLEEVYGMKMPSLTGYTITLIYDQKTGAADPDLANKVSVFYARWFKEQGATVRKKANL